MALLIYSSDSVTAWVEALRAAAPTLDVRVWPELGNPSDIGAALVWNPDMSVLRGLPHLKAILSMGAGVDHILRQGELPKGVRLARIVDDSLSASMSQYISYHVIRYCRHFDQFNDAKRSRSWNVPRIADARDWNVGFLGFGVLASYCADVLMRLGFKVRAFSRSGKSQEGVETFDANELDKFLSGTRILVCLLPLTKQTGGILNTPLFEKLPKGAYLISVGRGAQQIETDILAALDSGQLAAATLDVFEQEPLPPWSPFWSHPNVFITPHCAADADPKRIAPTIVENISRAERGLPLIGETDIARGY